MYVRLVCLSGCNTYTYKRTNTHTHTYRQTYQPYIHTLHASTQTNTHNKQTNQTNNAIPTLHYIYIHYIQTLHTSQCVTSHYVSIKHKTYKHTHSKAHLHTHTHALHYIHHIHYTHTHTLHTYITLHVIRTHIHHTCTHIHTCRHTYIYIRRCYQQQKCCLHADAATVRSIPCCWLKGTHTDIIYNIYISLHIYIYSVYV